eukprot:5718082-Heterocapsa_arctica.AAC.1
METRRTNASIWLNTPTGTLIAVPGCGALMGDSRAPVDFRKAYRPGLEKWQSELEETWDTEDTKASIDLGNDLKWTSNLGTTIFADDLARTQ